MNTEIQPQSHRGTEDCVPTSYNPNNPQAKPGSHAFMAGKAREVAEFCLRNGQSCFTGWPVPILFAYAFYHLVDRTLFTVRANGGIAGLMFAWGGEEAAIRARHAAGESPFSWKRSQDRGDAIFVAEVVAPRGQRDLARLFKMAASRWPDWQRKKVFTYRAGELVQLAPELLKRMIYGSDTRPTTVSQLQGN